MEKNVTVEVCKKDKTGFKATDGSWYSNKFKEFSLNKGDNVKITLDEKGFLQTAEVTSHITPTSFKQDAFRLNVDAGNSVDRAIELMKLDSKIDLNTAVQTTVLAFQKAQHLLENPIEEQSSDIQTDLNENGEYE